MARRMNSADGERAGMLLDCRARCGLTTREAAHGEKRAQERHKGTLAEKGGELGNQRATNSHLKE